MRVSANIARVCVCVVLELDRADVSCCNLL